MSLRYSKAKQAVGEGQNWWTSYADLFLVMSTIFLMLFVVASLRTSTTSVQQQLKAQEMASEASDLKEQLKVYSALKDDYLTTSASNTERQLYEELMKKLSLLKDEAKQEKVDLRLQAMENEKKEVALNQYQQIIRNIINANMLAKSGLKTRDEVIETKRQVIKEKSGTIAGLERSAAEKERILDKNRNEIAKISGALAKKISDLREAEQSQEITKDKMTKQIAQLKKESQDRIRTLNQANREVEAQLANVSSELSETSHNLRQTTGDKERLTGENDKLQDELKETAGRYAAAMRDAQDRFDKAAAAKKAAFADELQKAKLDGTERARREKEFRGQAEKESQGLKDRLSDLGGKMKAAEGKLAAAEKARDDYAKYVDNLGKEKAVLAADLKRSKDILDAKKRLAEGIRKSLNRAGVDADVNQGGDVVINFGEEYFDTGRFDLKPKMEAILNNALPAYAKGLFADGKIANEIEFVEIIGFASPTYQGKYVDPQKLDSNGRSAVNYNMDLSYNRARSIFRYIFDPDKLSFDEQKRLLPLVKVTGRSFLADDVKGRDDQTGIDTSEYCRKFDCKKSQRVIIKFDLKH